MHEECVYPRVEKQEANYNEVNNVFSSVSNEPLFVLVFVTGVDARVAGRLV